MTSTTAKKTKHLCYEPNSGTANCYHCGDWYQVTPCSLRMVGVILKQFEREHRVCKKQPGGEARLAQVIKDNEGKPMTGFGRLTLRPGATLGEKIAHNLEMQYISKALRGEEIPEGLKNDPKFMKAVEDLRAAGVSLESTESG